MGAVLNFHCRSLKEEGSPIGSSILWYWKVVRAFLVSTYYTPQAHACRVPQGCPFFMFSKALFKRHLFPIGGFLFSNARSDGCRFPSGHRLWLRFRFIEQRFLGQRGGGGVRKMALLSSKAFDLLESEDPKRQSWIYTNLGLLDVAKLETSSN